MLLLLLSVLLAQQSPVRADRALTIAINIPAYTLELKKGDSVVRSFRVAIGDSAHQTPTGSYRVDRVEWDPWWVPPASEWAQDEQVTPPGPQNPMGRVRLPFRELYFIHGSPMPNSIGQPLSHGCIRLSNGDAIALARLVLATAAPSIPKSSIDSIAGKRGKTRIMPLDVPVPVTLRYELATVSAGRLSVRRDVYGLARGGDRMAAVLEALAAVDEVAEADTARIRAALDRTQGAAWSAPLSSLKRKPAPVIPAPVPPATDSSPTR